MTRHPRAIAQGMSRLLAREPLLAQLVDAAGMPPPRREPAGFPTLLRIIVAQQVSTGAAAAIWARLAAAAAPLTPENLLALPDETLRGAGLSRPKVAYARDLAARLADRRLNLARLARLDDEDAIAMLAAVKGIGRWSAEIYLMFAHGRPDMWPADDIAVQAAFQHLRGLDARPNGVLLRRHGEGFRPHRSAAALLLWHYYRHRVRAAMTDVLPG
ncbi:MAG: DNA-3-methyladenine glycosylase 2 family protein [Alphaproteobacteria bacterium]|nr:DNA-3-methyladenine glycosylase 2 family protein [Alphaproteobacteria bacterium]